MAYTGKVTSAESLGRILPGQDRARPDRRRLEPGDRRLAVHPHPQARVAGLPDFDLRRGVRGASPGCSPPSGTTTCSRRRVLSRRHYHQPPSRRGACVGACRAGRSRRGDTRHSSPGGEHRGPTNGPTPGSLVTSPDSPLTCSRDARSGPAAIAADGPRTAFLSVRARIFRGHIDGGVREPSGWPVACSV